MFTLENLSQKVEVFSDRPDFIRPSSITAHPALRVVGEAAGSTQEPCRPFEVVTRTHCDTWRTCHLKPQGLKPAVGKPLDGGTEAGPDGSNKHMLWDMLKTIIIIT